jgi:hypothetical protein
LSEHCTVEKSVVHFIDHRYGVCLYRYQKDELTLDVDSNETAQIKEAWAVQTYHQVQIKTGGYTATRTVEWRLIQNGQQSVLSSEISELQPFGAENNGLSLREMGITEGVYLDYKPDPKTRMVLLFPTPPSQGIPWSAVLCRFGCYEFGYDTPMGMESVLNRLDGGAKDHFYPEWCRNLQSDPFWRKAADSRYLIDWFKVEPAAEASYIPPAVTSSPIPLGSYARHPQVGTGYQFLVDKDTLITGRDFNKQIDAALADKKETHDTTLYYPIGVI